MGHSWVTRGVPCLLAVHSPESPFYPSLTGFELQVLPVGAENLCHQAILVNHASGAVVSLNPEMVQVGYAVGQRAQWRGLLEGSVRPVGIVKVLVLPQHHHQVTLVADQGPVQQLTPAAANPPLLTEFIRGA